MIGREGELRAVKEALHATQADGRARLVVVTGVAGVGKSRLGWEFEKYVDGLRGRLAWHRGRSLSYGEGAAFWAFAEMMRSRLRILETDDRTTVADKTAAGVRAAAASEQEAAWLLPRVAALVGGNEAVSFDRTDLFVAWTTFLERVGGADPVVLVFEDAQYADSGLLDLVEHLMQSIRCKLFVLVLARTELLERWPALAEGRGRTRVDLAPLSQEAMAALLDGLVAELPVRARGALVARAEGVPLYAVETVRSLIDQDAVVARDGQYVFVDHDHAIVDLERLTAPTSLQTLIAARLDALSAVERRTVQDASVLGMTFRYASLLALTGTSSHALDDALAGLVGKGVLETQVDPRSPELGQYRFLQAMVREVAYSTLARADRRARHLAAAEQLTREEAEGSEALAGIIAQHLLDALAASSETDPERPRLSARARTLLTTAATRAEGLGAPEEALANTLTALALDPDDRSGATCSCAAPGSRCRRAGSPRPTSSRRRPAEVTRPWISRAAWSAPWVSRRGRACVRVACVKQPSLPNGRTGSPLAVTTWRRRSDCGSGGCSAPAHAPPGTGQLSVCTPNEACCWPRRYRIRR